MNKADKILIEIENYYAKEFPATMEMRIHFKTLIQKYADEQSRECKSCGQLLPDECPDCEQSMFI